MVARIFATSFFLTSLAVVLLTPAVVDAQLQPGAVQGSKDQLANSFGDTIQGLTPDPRYLAAYYIQVFLGILGTVFFGLVLFSGWEYLTARGQQDKVQAAQVTMQRAVIGLLVIFISYGIVRFTLLNIQGAVNQGAEYYEEDRPVNNETNRRGINVVP